MPPVILFCGFKPIQDIGNFYRDQALEKGKRLFQNNHVYGVREENGTDIAAKCHSQQGKHVYDVTLQLIQDSRKVVAGSCTCRYGVLGECKHSAAVVHYINTHEVSACTSVPQAWGKPSKRPKLSDKASIGDLFGGNRSNFVGKQEPREVLPRYIIDHFPDIDTPFTDILRLTGQNQVELECAQLLEDIVNDAVTIVRKSEVEVVLQHLTHQASDGEALKYRQDQLTDPEKAFFQKRVASRDVLGICMATMAQSKCAQWYQERKVRISSTMAHTILRTRKTPQDLVASLMNTTSFSSDATTYGLQTEPKARRRFEEKFGAHIVEVGLLVHQERSWLCGSADGVFQQDGETVLLEIKCPSSIKGQPVVDANKRKTFTSCLVYINDKLCLKPSHNYYTQVQVLMFVLDLQSCYFYVYTCDEHDATVLVPRNDKFLNNEIPSLEWFYFSWYLPALAQKYQI
ncbi:uncharacterized protein ISCGN_016724 [Ixodes scapularis]